MNQDSGWRKRQIALDKKADNARELGLDYDIRKPLKEHEIAQILDRERMKWNKSPPTHEFDLAFARAIEAEIRG